jgi:hypothetical protein
MGKEARRNRSAEFAAAARYQKGKTKLFTPEDAQVLDEAYARRRERDVSIPSDLAKAIAGSGVTGAKRIRRGGVTIKRFKEG